MNRLILAARVTILLCVFAIEVAAQRTTQPTGPCQTITGNWSNWGTATPITKDGSAYSSTQTYCDPSGNFCFKYSGPLSFDPTTGDFTIQLSLEGPDIQGPDASGNYFGTDLLELTYAGTLHDKGCNFVNTDSAYTFENGDGSTATYNFTQEDEFIKDCDVPTGESSTAFPEPKTDEGYVAGIWNMTLTPSPTTLNFGGRTINENGLLNGDPNFQDTCSAPGLPIYGGVHINMLDWAVDTHNVYGNDNIGPSQEAVGVYREAGRTPCKYRFSQSMQIICTDRTAYDLNNVATQALTPYQLNIIGWDITDSTVVSWRTNPPNDMQSKTITW